jgi:hypothetical protein
MAEAENRNKTERRLHSANWKPGVSGNSNGRPKKGNSLRELLRSVPVRDKRALVRIAYEEALQNHNVAFFEWIAKHSGESGQGEGAVPFRELIIRQYAGFDPSTLE